MSTSAESPRWNRTDPVPATRSLAELLAWVGEERLDSRAAREVTRWLRARGLRATPALGEVLADAGQKQTISEWDGPGRLIEGAALRDTVVRVQRAVLPAMVGAVLVTAIAAAVAWYRWPAYGAVSLAAGGLSTVAAWRWFDVADRKLPSAVSRGALLGAGLALCGILAALLIFVAVRHLAGASA